MHKIEKFTLTPLEQKEKGAQMTPSSYNNTLNNSKSQ